MALYTRGSFDYIVSPKAGASTPGIMKERPVGLLTFTIKPNIPGRLLALEELARNLWISWNYEAIMLFMRLDYDAWTASRQSPVRMLGLVSQEKLEQGKYGYDDQRDAEGGTGDLDVFPVQEVPGIHA